MLAIYLNYADTLSQSDSKEILPLTLAEWCHLGSRVRNSRTLSKMWYYTNEAKWMKVWKNGTMQKGLTDGNGWTPERLMILDVHQLTVDMKPIFVSQILTIQVKF